MIFAVNGEVRDEEDFAVDAIYGLVDAFFTVEESDGGEFVGDFFDFGFVVGEVGSGDSEVDDNTGSNVITPSPLRGTPPLRGENFN